MTFSWPHIFLISQVKRIVGSTFFGQIPGQLQFIVFRRPFEELDLRRIAKDVVARADAGACPTDLEGVDGSEDYNWIVCM